MLRLFSRRVRPMGFLSVTQSSTVGLERKKAYEYSWMLGMRSMIFPLLSWAEVLSRVSSRLGHRNAPTFTFSDIHSTKSVCPLPRGGEFVIFPSIWYEGCSMVEIESESLGLPLVATDLGFSAEAIEDGVNGLKFNLGDIGGLVSCIKRLWNSPELCSEMGRNARFDYERKYQPEDNYHQLMRIYQATRSNRCS